MPTCGLFLNPFIWGSVNKLLLWCAHVSNLLCQKQRFQEANRITQGHLISCSQSRRGVQNLWPVQGPVCATEWLKIFSDMEIFPFPYCKSPFQESGKELKEYPLLYILFLIILRLVVHRPHFKTCIFKSSSNL